MHIAGRGEGGMKFQTREGGAGWVGENTDQFGVVAVVVVESMNTVFL